jgi:indolepyruvate ferredoxin oxidoreductase
MDDATPQLPLGSLPSFHPQRRYLSGIQALVQLPVLQRQRDLEAGLNTAGFVSGYRGSPLGALDQTLWRQNELLRANHVHFEPGVNEELAATAVWGTQQVSLFKGAKYDGVFSMWYGKGPGADRCVDVFKHGNSAGTSKHGGVLVIVGDDHGAKSSSLPHQSDHIFAASMIPVLNPSTPQEFLDFGLHGWAMSRFSGCWIAMKAIADTVETSAGVELDLHRVTTRIPTDFEMPSDGVNIRWPDQPLAQELRLQRYKVYAAMAYVRLNGLSRIIMDSPRPRLGIITTGKSYLDVREALDELGIDEAAAAEIGIRLYKVAMPWPLDSEGVRNFAQGLDEVLVVEEKRQLIEYQLKEQLYNWREDVRPRVVGKYDDKGEWELPMHDWQLPAAGELTPSGIARVIAQRIARFHIGPRIIERLDFLAAKERELAQPHAGMLRVPHYCSGCPHNTSTRVPEGSRALAGIGCHYMATWLYPATQTFSAMGGEGVAWVGQAPFTETKHVFANLGDGTYMHSGILAIRQALAAKVPITYKILYNDAVAMTGGQPIEGALTVPQIVRQVAAEGVERIEVVTDEPTKYTGALKLPDGTPVHHRRELDAVQRDLREYPGVSVLLYDQTCAAEKRRRRKRGTYPDPAKRVVINDRVCEGCGDCSATSNCMSVVPVETEFGRKREIDQSSCNKDFSCVEGFCPSFVTVLGGSLQKGKAPQPSTEHQWDLTEPTPPALDRPYGILVTGVGGTGVVTIGALLGTAATLEGKGATVLDMAGLAQKGGPVWSHVRIAAQQDELFASRIAAGEANLVLGCDVVVTVADDTLIKMRCGKTHAVVNTDFSVTSDFVRAFAEQANSGDVTHVPDPQFPLEAMEKVIADAVGGGNFTAIPATRIATALLGDSIATNLFMVGHAWQQGRIPLRAESILKAIEMNKAAVEMNKAAFLWGRRAAADLGIVEAVAVSQAALPDSRILSTGLDETIARRVADLTAYQSRRYARRYERLVQRVRKTEEKIAPGHSELAEAVARCYYKLLAYKDEYEVARLYTQTDFFQHLGGMFEGDYKIVLNLAPPLWARRDKITGVPRKHEYGPHTLPLLKFLAHMKFLRATPLDVFAYSEDRRLDRSLLSRYERVLNEVLAQLTTENHAVAVELAALPEAVRGYGHIRRRHAGHAAEREEELLAQFRGGDPKQRVQDLSAATSRERVLMAG